MRLIKPVLQTHQSDMIPKAKNPEAISEQIENWLLQSIHE
jgi:hypothetical protein